MNGTMSSGILSIRLMCLVIASCLGMSAGLAAAGAKCFSACGRALAFAKQNLFNRTRRNAESRKRY